MATQIMINSIRISIIFLALFTVLLGFVYPLAMTAVAQLVFPSQANGSLIEEDGRVLGSRLIGQNFDAPGYFWGRPSATSPMPYNASTSGGTNLAPGNPTLLQSIQDRLQTLKQADPANTAPVPVDLVTSSASGLDPHISLAAALYQANRVARERRLPVDQVKSLIEQFTMPRLLGVLGEPVVNVLELNLALDRLQ